MTTSGDASTGLLINGAGGTLIANNVRVTTSGSIIPAGDTSDGAYNGPGGGYAAGGNLSITNSTILTEGHNATGVATSTGGVTTVTGGSVETTGLDSIGIHSEGGGNTTVTGTSVTTTGDGAKGLFIDGTRSSLSASNLTVTTHGTTDAANNDHAEAVFNGSGNFAGGGTATLTNLTIKTSGDGSNGVVTEDGGRTTLYGGSVNTTGNAAYAVTTNSGGLVSLNGTAIGTTGNGSGGLGINGGEIDATNVTITTMGAYYFVSGQHSYGVYNGPFESYASGGVAKLTNTSVSTQGVDMHAVFTSTGGATTILGGSFTTAGSGAHAIFSESGGTTSVDVSASGPTTLATTGTSAAAVVAYADGAVQLTGATVTTSGAGSTGLAVNGAGSSLSASGVSVATKGGIDPTTGDHADGAFNGPYLPGGLTSGGTLSLTNSTIATSGAGANGVVTEATGTTTRISGGSIATTGPDANAFDVGTGATAQITGTTLTASANGSKGVVVTDSGTTLTASGITVTTKGGLDPATGFTANGVYSGPSSSPSSTSGGTVNIANSTITTTGNDAAVVVAELGGVVNLAGSRISATGALGSSGLAIHDGGRIDATNVTVTTLGGFDSATGRASYGVANDPFGSFTTGGVAIITDSSISTQGAGMYGVHTSTGGATTLTGTSVATGGLGASGVVTQNGGVTNVGGGSVATSGQDAHALFATGSGSKANLSGAGTFATTGDGAIGLYAKQGGVINASGGAATITTTGGVSSATGLGAYGVNADGAGSAINLAGAVITTSGAGASALLASDRSASGAAGTITATGPLIVNTTNASTAAVMLEGDGASIAATGGGTITSAGDAIEFTNAANAVATFDNFTINNTTGDLVLADPSTAIVNFNATTANAGLSNLLDATNGSVVTLNASASTLTGVIKTDPTSTTNVNLLNGTTWTMTGSSNVTNLAVTNSVIVFAPPSEGGGFKTLTVSNYVGNGAIVAMNVVLGGSNSAADQIIVNSGKATGSTLLMINNAGGLGAHTTGAGIPIVTTANGGTIAPNAFGLGNVPLAGGFRYMLEESNNDWYLVSTPAPTPGQVQGSINQVAKAQQTQIITNRVLDSLLLGATQQISACSCAGGFASVGSFAAGAAGRWGLSDELSLIGGFSYNDWYASGISVQNAPTVAGALLYDFWKWGESRPFLEVGGALTPYEDVHYSRYYPNGLTTGVGNASAVDRDLSLFGRAGWIDRLTPTDEAAVYGDLSRSWMQTGGYTEMSSALNPFPTTVNSGLDTLNVARLGGQLTHLFNGNIEANVTAAVAYGFGAGAGAAVSVYDFGPIAPNALPNTAWMEYGARLGYRFNDRLVIDAFVVGTAFGEVGTTVHGGVGLRYAF